AMPSGCKPSPGSSNEVRAASCATTGMPIAATNRAERVNLRITTFFQARIQNCSGASSLFTAPRARYTSATREKCETCQPAGGCSALVGSLHRCRKVVEYLSGVRGSHRNLRHDNGNHLPLRIGG